MGWIKRNLLFVIVGFLTMGLLGGGGFYIYTEYSANNEAFASLNELYGKLQEIANSPQQPGDDKTDNMATAKAQEQQMRAWISQAVTYFHPISPIPAGEVTSKTYATALNATIYQLRQEAKDNSVTIPPDYNFSFQAQSTKLTISSGLVPLAQQLGEVKTIMDILYGARINELTGIERVRVSDDDASGATSGGLPSDYIEDHPTTTDSAIITPYVITFLGFTPELSRVLSAFAASSNLFIVKSVSVKLANSSGAAEPNAPVYNSPTPRPGDRYSRMMGQMQPVQPPPGTPMPGKGGLQTVLKEQLLNITLEVDIVKLLPKS
jgi:hypothetical protein